MSYIIVQWNQETKKMSYHNFYNTIQYNSSQNKNYTNYC